MARLVDMFVACSGAHDCSSNVFRYVFLGPADVGSSNVCSCVCMRQMWLKPKSIPERKLLVESVVSEIVVEFAFAAWRSKRHLVAHSLACARC